MTSNGKPQGYYSGYNERLLRLVPPSAKRILDVGCGEGNLGVELKKLDADRVVFGIERDPAAAAKATSRLDQVFALEVETEDVPIEPASVDCMLFDDVLEHVIDPCAVLRRLKPLLHADGMILCSIPNIQHHSVIGALLRSDFQYTDAGLLDNTHLRFFTYSTFMKLLLDAGFEPEIVDTMVIPGSPEFYRGAEPILRHLGLNRARTEAYLNAYQFVFRGVPLAEVGEESGPERALSFVCCVSNEQILEANFLSSPCLRGASPHEVRLIHNPKSAADGLNDGLKQAKNEVVVCVHQDVYLPEGWVERFWQQYNLAHKHFSPVGVLGVYGVHRDNAFMSRAGHVIDRDHVLKEDEPLPACVDSLDELLLAVPKAAGLEFDPALGFHFYGADICLVAQQRGLRAVAVDALCFHNTIHVGLAPSFYESARTFTAKWGKKLPLVTPSAVIDIGGNLSVA
jgi:SAM-dependent methyltransferase